MPYIWFRWHGQGNAPPWVHEHSPEHAELYTWTWKRTNNDKVNRRKKTTYSHTPHSSAWLSGRVVREPDLQSTGHRFKSRLPCCQVKAGTSCLHKQYNLVPANGRWCLAAGEITVGLAESNGSLLPGLWLQSPADRQPRTGISFGTLRSLRLWDYLYIIQWQKALRETQTLRAGCSKAEPKIFAPPQTPSRGAGWPKFYQLEMVTTFTCRPSLVKIDARNIELSW